MHKSPVTELATLRIRGNPGSGERSGNDNTTQPVLQLSKALTTKLKQATQAQATYSKYPVLIYRAIEDPNILFLLGGWSSVSAHMDDWIPGPINQELMKSLTEDIEVLRMYHLGIPPLGSSVESDSITKNSVTPTLPLDIPSADIVAIGRHTIKTGQRDEFAECFNANVGALQEYIGGIDHVAGGWRVDRGYDPSLDDTSSSDSTGALAIPDEFVLFTAWPAIEIHMQFAKTDAFLERYSKIRESVEKFEVMHARKVEL